MDLNMDIFTNMSYGVYIVGTMDGDRPTGCTANSIMQITAFPPSMAASINHDNYTNECIRKSGYFSFSILAEDSPSELIGRFGFQSGRDVNKFDGVDYEMVEGMPVLKKTCGYVVCKVTKTLETDTHTIFLGDVVATHQFKDPSHQMTYEYYHKVVKGKSPKNAPTYIPEDKAPAAEEKPAAAVKVKWVCNVCGYEYEGDDMPDDFVCPICGVGKDQFTRVVEEIAPEPPKKKVKWVCNVCGYEYEGDDMPDDFVCPICGVGKDQFTRIEVEG